MRPGVPQKTQTVAVVFSSVSISAPQFLQRYTLKLSFVLESEEPGALVNATSSFGFCSSSSTVVTQPQ